MTVAHGISSARITTATPQRGRLSSSKTTWQAHNLASCRASQWSVQVTSPQLQVKPLISGAAASTTPLPDGHSKTAGSRPLHTPLHFPSVYSKAPQHKAVAESRPARRAGIKQLKTMMLHNRPPLDAVASEPQLRTGIERPRYTPTSERTKFHRDSKQHTSPCCEGPPHESVLTHCGRQAHFPYTGDPR